MKIPLNSFFDYLLSTYKLDKEKNLDKRAKIIEKIISDLDSVPKNQQNLDLVKIIQEIEQKYSK